LQAEVAIDASGPVFDAMRRLGDDLRFVLITSAATLRQAAGSEIGVTVQPSSHSKCERCWHYRADVGLDPQHPELCGRCTSNLYGAGEPRAYA
jgi:isoleucyl-tRNA synthetase